MTSADPTSLPDPGPPPYRGLSPAFLDALDQLASASHGGWWRDVLAHPDLVLAVRREALDVYHRGASLFRVRFVGGEVRADTHAKYLVRQGQTRINLEQDGTFAVQDRPLLWSVYAGPQTLAEMVKAASTLVGPEKTGVHALVQASPNVVDVEIALAGHPVASSDLPDTEDNAGADAGAGKTGAPRQDRLDVASLEERGDPREAWLVFHEAKDYANSALRSAPKRKPGIVAQMGRYQGSIGGNASELAYSYPHLCRALVRLDALRCKVRADHPDWAGREQPALDPLIREVADGTRRLRVECVPRLVVFGFDADQRDGAWAAECARLRDQFGLRVYAVGDPSGVKVAAALRRPADMPLTPPPSPPAPPPEHIPLPQGTPPKLCLYFGDGHGSGRPVYLCNPGETALTEVQVTSVGVTANHAQVLHTGTATATLPEAPARGGVLVDTYDVFADGDMLTPYAVTARRADGSVLTAKAVIGKGGPSGRFVPLDVGPSPASPSPATS